MLTGKFHLNAIFANVKFPTMIFLLEIILRRSFTFLIDRRMKFRQKIYLKIKQTKKLKQSENYSVKFNFAVEISLWAKFQWKFLFDFVGKQTWPGNSRYGFDWKSF